MRTTISILGLSLLVAGSWARAAEPTNVNFNYQNVPLVQVIKDYSKVSGQKFIIDPSLQGNITIINAQPITLEEAFNQLSIAMMVNSVAVSKQNGTMVVMPARNIQRNLIDVGSELPSLQPERMFTWSISLKNASADEVNKQLRILTSKDGELVPYPRTNKILVTDWVSNLYRIQKIIAEIDRPAGAKAKQ